MCLMPYYAETHQHNNLFGNRRCSPRVLFFGEISHPSDQNIASDIHTKNFYWDKCPKVARFQGFFIFEITKFRQ